MIQEGLKTSNYREITKWNEVIQGGIDAEILIVGSSRALVHFDCEYIEKLTGKTCYNLGFDGTTYPLQKLMLELYLSKNKKPKELIWSLDFHSFSFDADFYGFEQLVPYQDNPSIRKILDLHETPSYQFYIPVFRYSYNPKMKVIGLYSFFGKYEREPVVKNGFQKQDKVWDGSFEQFKKEITDCYEVVIEDVVYQDFLELNKRLNEKSKVLWVVTPYFIEFQNLVCNRIQIVQNWGTTSTFLDIPLMDFSQNQISTKKENFYNSTHLSRKGVYQFMGELAKIWQPN
jgi:hypothetical protein